MPPLDLKEIQRRFEHSTEFNEIFDAFEQALTRGVDDMELYRLLFWNKALSADEVRLFGDKLATELPRLAFDVCMWLANVFEVTYAYSDNYELAMAYFRKASDARPDAVEPYVEAADCYDHDLNLPPVSILIEFLKRGVGRVAAPKPLYERLSHFYEVVDNDEMKEFFRRKAAEEDPPAAHETGGEAG
jgi:tetratricopeptide (TPR) repeat protein